MGPEGPAAVDLLGNADATMDELGHLRKVLLLKSARRERGSAHADASGDEGALVARHRVLVERNRRELEDRLDARAVDAARLEVDEKQVILRATGDEGVAAVGHRRRERFV